MSRTETGCNSWRAVYHYYMNVHARSVNLHAQLKSTALAGVGAGTGISYGLFFLATGFLAAGAGHGNYAIIDIASAPFIYSGSFWTAMLALPVFWGVVGALLGAADRRIPRALFIAVISGHYAGAAVVFLTGRCDLSRLSRTYGVVLFALAAYIIGQITIWVCFILQKRMSGVAFTKRDALFAGTFFAVLFVLPGVTLYAYLEAHRDKEYAFEVTEAEQDWSVRLVRSHAAKEFPSFGDGKGQGVDAGAFTPGPEFHCIRRLDDGGSEICAWTPEAGTFHCVPLPEPEGFKPWNGGAAVWTNHIGDQLLGWTLDANGGQALALRPRGAGKFKTARVKPYVGSANCAKAICGLDGTWYLLVWHARGPQPLEVEIYSLDENLQPSKIGSRQLGGHHDIGVLDAAFISKDRIRLVWGSVSQGFNHVQVNWLQMHTIDFHVGERQWSAEQEIARTDRFVSWVHTAIHALDDGTIHYLWEVAASKDNPASGIFYRAEGSDRTLKVCSTDRGFKSLVVGNHIAVCYPKVDEPAKVFFRVIGDGKLGPESSINLGAPLDTFVVGAGAHNSFWLADLSDVKTLYELNLVEGAR